MYKEALQNLIETATRKFFEEKTGYKQTACFKVELKSDDGVRFAADVVACDNDPKWGEFFTVNGYLCYNIEFTMIKDRDGKIIYDRYA